MKEPEQRRQTRPSPGYLLEFQQKGPLCKQVSRTSEAKKLVLVLATSALVTGASKGAPKVVLDRVLCIYYPVQFWKNKKKATIQALIDFGSEVNAMIPAYAKQLGLRTRKTDVEAQKIDGSLLLTYAMVIAAFQVKNKLGKARFFQETFLLADTSMKVVLRMPFLTLGNADI